MNSMQLAVTRITILLSCCLLGLTASASTINVPAQQPTIQAGINAAVNGDTVLVAAGTYAERINFSGKNIKVLSAGGPAVTIIDGGGWGNAVTFSSNETSAALISGFTIRNASQSAVFVSGASPVIQNNVILQTAYYSFGCGIYLSNAGATVAANLFSSSSGSICYQGTIYVSGNSPAQITGNVIAGNPADGIYIDSLSGPLSVVSNTIIDNQGHGINANSIQSGGSLSLIQNVITNNQETGVFWSNPPVLMVNNTVAGNSSPSSFGFSPEGSEVYGQIVNNQITMENNLLVATGFSPAFSCDTYDYSNLGIIDHNDIEAANALPYGVACPDLTGTGGNLSVDPLFVALLSNNLHLSSTSPAIKHGSNSAPQLPSHDMDGDARILNTIVDIGADEYSPKTTLKLSAYELQFGPQKMGTTSTGKTLTLSNNGTAAVSIAMIVTTGEFSQSNNCPSTLAPATKCQIVVKFSPAGSGLRSSVLAITTGATLNPIAAELNGNGLTPNVNLNPSFLFYNSQIIGSTATQTSTLTNTGFAPLTITSFSLSGSADFSQTNNCPLAPAALAEGASCVITVTWHPTIVGVDNGSLAITDNAVPNSQSLSFEGISYSAGITTVTPSTLTFPATLLGNTSAPQTLTLTNTGTGPLGNIRVNSFYDFPYTTTCPVSLAAGASCTISVSFAPSSVGTETGYIWVNDDDITNGTTINVSGQGQAPVPVISSLSPSSVAAGSGNTTVTVTGTGFVSGTQVLYNGVPLWTSFGGSSTQVAVTIPTASLAEPGTGVITVFNPSPGGGTSNALPLTIYAPLNYAVTSTTYSYKTITGTNLKLSPWTSAQVTSPFAIQFGGGNFNVLTVAGSGTISFSNFAGDYSTNAPIPYSATSTLVAPFWTGLYPFGTGANNNVFWQVTGTAPSRQLVVEWRNVEYFPAPATTQTVKFEVVFFEGNGKIVFNYADTVFGGTASAADNGATASVGVQVSPSLGYQYSYNTASLASGTSLLWYPNAPTATVSTNTLNFGWDQIGTPTAAQKLTLTNGSLVPLHMSGITTNNSDFTTTNNCGSTVAAGASCSINVTFDPSSPLAESATLTINDDALGGPQTVTLNGIGAIQTTVVFPINLRFGLQNVGTSATLPVTLANAATTTMTIQSITASPSVYTQTNNCGSSLVAGASCTINVTFTPTATGLVNGTLSMGLNGNASQVMVNLSGQGQ